MPEYDVFPDAEKVASLIVRDNLGERAYSSIPRSPTYPLTIVQRTGGVPQTRMRLDAADIQFDCWAASKSAAYSLAARIRTAMHEAEGTVVGDAFVTGVTDVMGLTWMPDPANKPKDRYVFTMRVFLHRND